MTQDEKNDKIIKQDLVFKNETRLFYSKVLNKDLTEEQVRKYLSSSPYHCRPGETNLFISILNSDNHNTPSIYIDIKEPTRYEIDLIGDYFRLFENRIFTIERNNTYKEITDYDISKFESIFIDLKSLYSLMIPFEPPAALRTARIRMKEVRNLPGVDNRAFSYYSFGKWLQKCLEETPKSSLRYNISFEPVTITNDPKVPSYLYVDLNAFKPAPHPTWDQFSCRFRDEEDYKLFKAWAWTTAETSLMGRQAPWIQGTGSVGKSTLQQVFTNYYGKQSVTGTDDDTLRKEFGREDLLGKWLIFYSDAKNGEFIKGKIAHNILGSDPITINRKFQKNIAVRLKCRMIIFSNQSPEIDKWQDNQVDRLLYIKMKGNTELTELELKPFCVLTEDGKVKRDGEGKPIFDGTLEKKLTDEFSAFMYSCKLAYQELGTPTGKILMSSGKLESMKSQTTGQTDENLEDILDDNFKFDPSYRIKRSVFNKVTQHKAAEYGHGVITAKFLKNNLIPILQFKFGISLVLKRDNKEGEWYYYGMRLKNTTEDLNEAFQKSLKPPINLDTPPKKKDIFDDM